MRGRHELGDERAPVGRAGERIRPDAPPAGVVAGLVVAPQRLVLEELVLGDEAPPPFHVPPVPRQHNRCDARPRSRDRPLGGGMNGLLMEIGFLRRLREDPLWERARLDLRHVSRSVVRRHGRARPPRRARGVRARAPAGGDVPAEPAVAAPVRRAARLRAARDDRRAARADRAARRRGGGAPRSSWSCCVTDVPRRRTRRAARLRARLLEPHDRAGRDGPGRARLGGDQRARPPAPRRRRHRHRRRLGAELPARTRIRQRRRPRDRRLPLHLRARRAGRGEPLSGSGDDSSRSAPSRPSAR